MKRSCLPKLAPPNPVNLAQQLRKRQTSAEAYLWEHLRKSKLDGCKFRRQHPMGGFILDFYGEEKRLAIEIDGGIQGVLAVANLPASRERKPPILLPPRGRNEGSEFWVIVKP